MMSLGLYSLARTDNHRNSGSKRVNMKIWSGVPSFNRNLSRHLLVLGLLSYVSYYIIQNIIDVRHLVPRLHLQRFGRWRLGTSAPAHECRLDFHHATVSRGQIMAPALACTRMRASLSRCVIARAVRSRSGSLRGPRRLRPATSRYRTRSLPVALSYVDLQSHARESENARLREST